MNYALQYLQSNEENDQRARPFAAGLARAATAATTHARRIIASYATAAARESSVAYTPTVKRKAMYIIKPIRDNVIDTVTGMLMQKDGVKRTVLLPPDHTAERVGDVVIEVLQPVSEVPAKPAK
jgi:hypothetical protein